MHHSARSISIGLALGVAGILGCASGTSTPTTPITPGGPPPGAAVLGLQRVASGLSSPLFLTAPAGDTRLFIVEQGGKIKVVKGGAVLATPFLDIGSKIACCGEQGLLGLAFDPQFATTKRFFVRYTDTSGNLVVSSFVVSSTNADVADGSSELIRLGPVPHPGATNHNGGMIAFGPDNDLYVGFGDGGGGGDPSGNGQNLNALLGKILRIDVSAATGYVVPNDNPYKTSTAARPEIWNIGVRNPWRFSFDRQTGDMYVADVGQGAHEEVDVALASSGRNAGKGLNYGWNTMEGKSCYSPASNCSQTGLTLPVLDYPHDATGGCSISGGYVYRGTAIPSIQGTYFYADYCNGWVRSFNYVARQATNPLDWTTLRPGGNIASFGEDGSGELYIITIDKGTVDKVVAQ